MSVVCIMLDTQYLIRIVECLEEGCVQAAVYVLLSYAGVLLVPHTVCCICLDAVFGTIVIAHPFVLLSYCAESLLLHHVSPSFIDVCLVLFCSAPSSLLLHHPVWAACTWGLMCFQLCLSLPLQE